MTKMKRQVSVHLLFACLLLAAASALNHVTADVQDIQSVHFKLRTLQASPMAHSGYVMPSRVEDKKTRKPPSGPNPIGNHRPPSEP